MNARNPATLAKLRTEAALCRSDLEHRGYKLPKQPDLGHRMPRMFVDGKEFPTFVVVRGEDYLAGKVSLWALVRTIDGGTVQDILDYVDARKSGHLREPHFDEEVLG